MLESQAPTISRTMTITHAEFRRTLANAVVGWDYRVQGDEIYVSLDSDTGIHIHLSEEYQRPIGPTVSLPQVEVTMEFVGLTSVEADVFLQRFDRYFQRGGG